MAQDKNTRMPSSGAGITNFSEDHHSKLAISPVGVLVYIIVIVTVVLLLRLIA